MAFDKNYPNRKDRRSPYIHGSSRFDRTCRPGGSCPWCQANRTAKNVEKQREAERQIAEYAA
jgi:hypothetical protein